jgi:DNA-binding response OmpR family regulator
MATTRPLTYQDLVTQTELREAVDSAGKYGGSIADHLLRLGFAGRTDLLAVLGQTTGSPAVDLRKISIDQSVLEKIPAARAWKLQALPLAYDQTSNKITIACANPDDPETISQLKELFPNDRIVLCVALGTDLKCALMAHYREAVLGEPRDTLPLTLAVDSDDLSGHMIRVTASIPGDMLPAADLEEALWSASEAQCSTRILILAPDEIAVKYIANALRCDNCAVRTATDLDTALRYCRSDRFTHVFVHSSFSDLAIDILLKFRECASSASVRFFSGLSEFILSEDQSPTQEGANRNANFGKTMPISIGEANSRSRLLLLAPPDVDCSELRHKLEASLFSVHTTGSVRDCAAYFRQEGADIVLLYRRGNVDEIAEMVGELSALGYVMDRVPTYILTDVDVSVHLNWLLARGIEDIIPRDTEWQSLVIKLNRMRSRLEQEKGERIQVLHDLGTHGTLKDMNVIDLLQAMGPGDKTVRISVTGSGKQLTMFLDHGRLTYAACDEKIGAEAVYEGLTWRAGIWSVDPIRPDDLPEPNNERSIDSILIEGCHLLDEISKSEFPTIG